MEYSVKPEEMEFLLPRNMDFNIFHIDDENKILKVLDENF